MTLLKVHDFLAYAPDNCYFFAVGCPKDYYEKSQSKYFFKNKLVNLSKLVSSTFDKKEGPIQCSYKAFRYNVLYIYKNCQTAIIFNNVDFG